MTEHRVLVDVRTVSRRIDGLGRYTIELVRAMLPRAEPDLRLVLLTPSDAGRDHPLADAFAETEVFRVEASLMSMRAQLDVPLAVRAARVELYHFPHFVLPLATPGRVVVTIHDLNPARAAYFAHGGALKSLAFRVATGWSVRRAAAVIAPSEATAREVRRSYGVSTKVVAITEGVPSRQAPPTPERAATFRDRHRLQHGYFLYVGVDRPHKNLPRLLGSFSRIAATIPQDLVLIGRIDLQASYLGALVERLHLSGRVRVLGYVDDDDLAAAYAGADGFVLCSTWEGFGLPVLEAMQLGVPVVTSKIGAAAEVADGAALLVDPFSVEDIAAALVEIGTRPALRHELSRRGRERAARYTWATAAERTLELYRSVIG